MKLENQVTVVTGAGRGIGKAIAALQAKEGAKVALIARSGDEIDTVAKEIEAAGGTARAYKGDITDTAGMAAVFEKIENDLGPIDLLTNNAGAFGGIGPIWEVDPEVWWRDVETNLRGAFNCCRAVLPGMLKRKSGRIINLTGGGTGTPFPHGSGYGSSKAGVQRFTESVSGTLEDTGVLMFAMDPGLVHTSMTDYQLESDVGQTWLSDLPDLFANKIDVPPSMAARLSVEIGSGRFDRLKGRMMMAARGDLDLTESDIDEILAGDYRSLRITGEPEEKPREE